MKNGGADEQDLLTCPLVSIIIPCDNGEQFVGEAIESALDQSYPSVEIVVADDGSTDHSSELIAQYSTRLICNNHQGFRPLVIGAFKRAEVSFSSFSPRITNCSFEFRGIMQCDAQRGDGTVPAASLDLVA